MKAKYLLLAITALLVVGGSWFARMTWRAHRPMVTSDSPDTTQTLANQKSDVVKEKRANQEHHDINQDPAASVARRDQRGGHPNPDQRLRPPVPNRRFSNFTPEERVQFARQGHGPGG